MILPQKSVLEKGVDKKIHKGKRKGNFLKKKKKHCRTKARAREIPRVIPKEKEESPHGQTKQMERVQKHGIERQDRRGKNTGKGGKKNTGKSGSKGINNGGRSGGKAKKGQK